MPIVRIQMLTGRSEKVKAEIAEGVTELLIRSGGGSRQHTIVLFEEIAAENWSIGGDLVSSPKFAETQKAFKERLESRNKGA